MKTLAVLLILASAVAPVAVQAQSTDTPRLVTMEAFASGAAACATRKLSQAKMAERLAAAGWKAEAAREPGKTIAMTSYRRENATLYYFASKPMTQCIVRGSTDKDFRPDQLVAVLTTQLGKAPKVDEPGRRYLYPLARLDILTLQIKADAADPHVELSVVH